jgi:5-methylcytosine-specific restriction endonuclease McrA
VKFECVNCGKLHDKKQVQVDHLVTVIPLAGLPQRDGLPDFFVYIARLFCPVENLQVLCKACHRIKTSLEATQRKQFKDKQNGKLKAKTVNSRGRKRKTTKTRTS